MLSHYFITVILGAVLSAALFSVRLKKARMKPLAALLTLLFSAALGFGCAKLVYFLLRIAREWHRYGLSGLLRVSPHELSFFGGCLGAVLGAVLAAAVARQPVKRFLDAFAPCGALMAAFARAGEYFLPGVNQASMETQPEWLCRFPFSVVNEYEEWYGALFFFSALCALAVCAVFLLRKKESAVPGLRFERVVFYLCLPRILLESLRSDSIKWGFVRAEQVLCAVCVFLVLVRACAAVKEKGFFQRFWPALADAAGVGVMVFIEFNLDRGYLPVSVTLNYVFMAAVLLGIAGCEIFCARRRLRQGS